MSNQEIVKEQITTLSGLLANTDENTYYTLKNSLYPGAKEESLGMIVAYCQAKKYDPLAKTAHIVPMSVKDSKTGQYEWRDVIMPGIAAYRIDADRTGRYVGLSEPEFGPTVTKDFDGVTVSYPAWCKITVKKLMDNGYIAEFTATEFWIENYATKGKGSIVPNTMWMKRQCGQLAKCTEAQALRKAFPDAVGNNPTFEEMEGKTFAQDSKEPKQAFKNVYELPVFINAEQMVILKEKISEAGSQEIDICAYLKIGCLEEMTGSQFTDVCRLLGKKIEKIKAEAEQIPVESTEVEEFFKEDE